MKVLLRVWGDDEGGDVNFVFVDVTKDLAQKIMSRSKAFKTLHGVDSDLVEVCYWDSSPVFLSASKLRKFGFTEEEIEKIDEDNRLDVSDMPPHMVDIKEEDGEEMEFCRMLISEDWVVWEADKKYAEGLTFSSEGIDLPEIEKAL